MPIKLKPIGVYDKSSFGPKYTVRVSLGVSILPPGSTLVTLLYNPNLTVRVIRYGLTNILTKNLRIPNNDSIIGKQVSNKFVGKQVSNNFIGKRRQ
jgi:hypothetical protein